MAIGTLAALAIGGGLLGSAAISSSASKSAGKKVAGAADAAAQLQNQQFEKQLALMMPGYNRAEAAAGVYGAALGLPSMTGGAPASGGVAPGGTDYTGYMTGNPDLMQAYQSGQFGGLSMAEAGQQHYNEYGATEGRQLPGLTPTNTPAQSAVTRQTIADQVMQTPGYQTQLDEGIKSIDRAAPLVGGMYSGRRMKALNDYGQNTFGSYYQDWLGKVGGVAGQAQPIAQNIGAAGQANANNVGGLMVQGANAQAQAGLNSANAWTSAIGTGVGLYAGGKGWI